MLKTKVKMAWRIAENPQLACQRYLIFHLRVFGGVLVTRLFSFMCWVVLLCFVCLLPVFCLSSSCVLFVFILCFVCLHPVFCVLFVFIMCFACLLPVFCLSSSCVLCGQLLWNDYSEMSVFDCSLGFPSRLFDINLISGAMVTCPNMCIFTIQY